MELYGEVQLIGEDIMGDHPEYRLRTLLWTEIQDEHGKVIPVLLKKLGRVIHDAGLAHRLEIEARAVLDRLCIEVKQAPSFGTAELPLSMS